MDGSLDGSFQNGLAGVEHRGHCCASVASVALQRDGKVLVGGHFTTVNGESRTNLARLNPEGTLDIGFQTGLSGTNDGVYTVVVQNDGKLLVGGAFGVVDRER